MSGAQYFEPSTKKPGGQPRGLSDRSVELIAAMYDIAEAAEPITGRGVGYKLFTRGLIPSMGRNDMHRVYRLLKEARECGDIPWEWIVDENRTLERPAVWDDPEKYAHTVARAYRRDFWNLQPLRVEVWSEKGTVRGLLQPVLNQYAVGFRVMHGFGSATTIHDVAQDGDGRELIVLYVGDYDPSGLCMSEVDLPERLEKYDGTHVTLERIALTREQVKGLPSFPATDKQGPAVSMVRRQSRRPLLGTRRDGSQRSPGLRRGCDQGPDRACRLGALRQRQSGGAAIAPVDLVELEDARDRRCVMNVPRVITRLMYEVEYLRDENGRLLIALRGYEVEPRSPFPLLSPAEIFAVLHPAERGRQ